MPLVDILILLGAAALVVGVAGWVGARADKSRPDKDAIERGIANAERIKREREQRCTQCDKSIDPNVDAYDQERWWCRDCWAKLNQ